MFLGIHISRFPYQQILISNRQSIKTVQNIFLLLATLLEKIKAEILCTTTIKKCVELL